LHYPHLEINQRMLVAWKGVTSGVQQCILSFFLDGDLELMKETGGSFLNYEEPKVLLQFPCNSF